MLLDDSCSDKCYVCYLSVYKKQQKNNAYTKENNAIIMKFTNKLELIAVATGWRGIELGI